MLTTFDGGPCGDNTSSWSSFICIAKVVTVCAQSPLKIPIAGNFYGLVVHVQNQSNCSIASDAGPSWETSRGNSSEGRDRALGNLGFTETALYGNSLTSLAVVDPSRPNQAISTIGTGAGFRVSLFWLADASKPTRRRALCYLESPSCILGLPAAGEATNRLYLVVGAI